MALTNFQDRITVITAAWLNYVDSIADAYTRENTPQSAPPASGAYAVGAFVKNSVISVSGPSNAPYIVDGWRCVTAGVVGGANPTWVEVRQPVALLTNTVAASPPPAPAPGPVAPPPYTSRLQGENLTGAGAMTGTIVPGYDGTGYADYATSTSPLTATFTGVAAGTYTINIGYFVYGTQQNFVKIDGGGNVSYTYPYTGTFGTWGVLSIPNVSLGSGTHTVSLTNDWGFTHYDYIELTQVVASPAPAPAPIPPSQTNSLGFNMGAQLHDWNLTSTANNTIIANTFLTRNLMAARIDLWGGAGGDPLTRDLCTKLKAVGVKVQGIIHTGTEGDYTIYTTAGDLNTVQTDSYNQATTIINSYKDIITDFEIFNETQLRSDLTSQVTFGSQGTSVTNYNASTAATSLMRRIKGVMLALQDIRTSSGLPIRIIFGLMGPDWGWGTYLNNNSVTWDVTGTHLYQAFGSPDIRTDTFWGAGGLMASALAFGKPVTINEFNAGDHYNAGYVDTAGNLDYENGLKGMFNHINELHLDVTTHPLESLIVYEFFNEPAKSFPENMFGLVRDLNTPKPDLYIATALAGGALTASEQAQITAPTRSVMTTSQIASFQPPFYPFGSRRDGAYPYGLTITGTTNAAMDASIKTAYDAWKNNRLAAAPAFTPTSGVYAGVRISDGYYVKFTPTIPPFATVSEGMGYGMIILVIMAGYDANAQAYFNGLLKVVRGSPAYSQTTNPNVNKYLMDWRLNPDMSSAGGGYNALDGDMDMALALLMAHRQWGSGGAINYYQEALNTIGAMKATDFATNGVMWAPFQDVSRVSDYMPGHFRAFKAATNDTFWDNARTNSYTLVNSIINTYSASAKLPPDWIYQPFSTNPVPSPGGKIEGPNEGIYGSNSVRCPWRWGLDFLFSGDATWKGLADGITAQIKTSSAGVPAQTSWAYTLAGAPFTGNTYFEPTTCGCVMVGAMCGGSQFVKKPVVSNVTTSTSGGTLAANTYYYKVTALNANGETLPGITELKITTTGTTSSNTITWVASTGATGYRVYRGTSAGGENVYYAPGNVTSYVDTNAASTGGTPPTVNTTANAGWQTFLNSLFSANVANFYTTYYNSELELIPMIIASGNWWKP